MNVFFEKAAGLYADVCSGQGRGGSVVQIASVPGSRRCPLRGQRDTTCAGTRRICSSTPLDGALFRSPIAGVPSPRRSGIAKAMPRLLRSGDTTCAGTRRICSSTPLVRGAISCPPRRSGIAKAMPRLLRSGASSCAGTRRIYSYTPLNGARLLVTPPPPRFVSNTSSK
jgi:hypothetical protein